MEALMRRSLHIFLAFSLTIFSYVPILAEGEEETTETETPQEVEQAPAETTEVTTEEPTTTNDFEDTNYWTNLCTGTATLTLDQKNACTAFMNYMSGSSATLKNRIEELEAERSKIAEDISYYGQLVMNYQADADALNGEISQLNSEIAVKDKEIKNKEESINESQAEIDAAEEKIIERMVIAQETMKTNKFLDILMGAKTFEDFVRIANGLSTITEYDKRTMEDLSDLIDQLNIDKAALQKDKEELAEKRQVVVDKQNEILAMKYQAQMVEEEYRRKAAELVALGNKYAADIEAIQETMRAITEKLNEVAAAPGWTYPIAGGHINPVAGTWAYASGGIHLGADFVAPKGTPLLACGNGVILNSVNGCGDGWLGNGCVGPGGSWGGGNQIDALYKINGGLYAVKYSHMLLDTPIPKGTVVMAGDVVGQLGMSGNATGPHCHLEIYYLGGEENFTSYATNWDGDLSFHCEWYTAALNHICENGASAPCRVRPESVFGG